MSAQNEALKKDNQAQILIGVNSDQIQVLNELRKEIQKKYSTVLGERGIHD